MKCFPYPLCEQCEHLLVVLGEPRDERLQLGDLLLSLDAASPGFSRTLRLLRLPCYSSSHGSFELLLGWGRENC